MKKIGCILAFLMISALTLTTFVFAKGPGGISGGTGEFGDINRFALAKLDLTKDQTDKIRNLHQTYYKNVMPLRVKAFEKRAELKLLWMQLDPDVSKIKTIQKELRGIQAEMDDKNIDFQLDMRKLLTSEQLSRYLTLQGEGKFHHGCGPIHGGKDVPRGPKGSSHGRGYMTP